MENMLPGDDSCEFCGGATARLVVATEKRFSLGGEFFYRQCAGCGALKLLNVPTDMSTYYPADKYYSYAPPDSVKIDSGRAMNFLADARSGFQIFGKPAWAKPIARFHASGVATSIKLRYFQNLPASVGLDMRILDVGCGGGLFLSRLSALGFRNLEGIDPFLSEPEKRVANARLRRAFIADLSGELFDFINCDHVLEHLSDQQGSLAGMGRLLKPGGIIRFEVPVADCDAYNMYGVDWVELDPPRHFYLHTRKSLELLVSKSGLTLVDQREAGSRFEFWGSEMYRRGRGFYDAALGRELTEDDLFLRAELEEFERLSNVALAAKRTGRLEMTVRA